MRGVTPTVWADDGYAEEKSFERCETYYCQRLPPLLGSSVLILRHILKCWQMVLLRRPQQLRMDMPRKNPSSQGCNGQSTGYHVQSARCGMTQDNSAPIVQMYRLRIGVKYSMKTQIVLCRLINTFTNLHDTFRFICQPCHEDFLVITHCGGRFDFQFLNEYYLPGHFIHQGKSKDPLL